MKKGERFGDYVWGSYEVPYDKDSETEWEKRLAKIDELLAKHFKLTSNIATVLRWANDLNVSFSNLFRKNIYLRELENIYFRLEEEYIDYFFYSFGASSASLETIQDKKDSFAKENALSGIYFQLKRDASLLLQDLKRKLDNFNDRIYNHKILSISVFALFVSIFALVFTQI